VTVAEIAADAAVVAADADAGKNPTFNCELPPCLSSAGAGRGNTFGFQMVSSRALKPFYLPM
jgi:hypothetical protein